MTVLTDCRSLEEATEIFTNATTRDTGNDSVEGIMFGENEAVIMSGVFVEEGEVELLTELLVRVLSEYASAGAKL